METAESCLGRPYKYGGEHPRSGFDCSGLTYYVYGVHGYKLPRRAKDQRQAGWAVKRSHLQPGDIVVFKTGWFSGYHVGIYVGKGRFIHAPNRGKPVQYERLDHPWYQKRYYTARRLG